MSFADSVSSTFRKAIASMAAFALAMTMSMPVALGSTATAVASENSGQPSCTHTFAENELAVVNFAPVWGDKAANVAAMKKYVKEAHAKGTKIILFPEMAVTGYSSTNDPTSKAYKMPLNLAEDLFGPTQRTFAKLAKNYGMWIIYGGTQKVYKKNGTLDTEHAYNSAFACSPDGGVTAFQKFNPIEGDWCKAGTTPVLLDAGEYGKLGLSVCYDTYSTPELARYYAAQGANIFLNLTATSRSYNADNSKGWEWYYENRLEGYASREGLTVLSANLVGPDGPSFHGSKLYNFPGGSVICQGTEDGVTYLAGVTSSQLGKLETDADILTGVEGVQYNCKSTTCTSGSTCSGAAFNSALYAKLYAKLAKSEGLSYSYDSAKGPMAAVVNMTGKWGDVDASAKIMEGYVEEAAEEGVDILVFPEMVLNGYQYIAAGDGSDPMQVKTAQSKDGAIAKRFAALAKANNMYIVYGASELPEGGPIEENGKSKVYNSAFVCSPSGTVTTYQKIHLSGDEDQWSASGSNPVTFTIAWNEEKGCCGDDGNTENDIKTGVDLGCDGYSYPEIGRYYAASGCVLLVQPSATTSSAWYCESSIGSYIDRDGMDAICCNLLGYDGPTDADGEAIDGNGDGVVDEKDGCTYAGVSMIATAYHDAEGYVDWDRSTGSVVDLNGTGSASAGYSTRGSSPAGLEIAQMNLSGTGFSIYSFAPSTFSKMYDKLAQLHSSGYTSLYSAAKQIAEPVTVNLSSSPKAAKITCKVSSKTYKVKTLAKKSRTFAIGAKVTSKAKIIYKVTKGTAKCLKVSSAGKVTMKKGCKKGTYKVTVSSYATAAYKAAKKVVTVRVK